MTCRLPAAQTPALLLALLAVFVIAPVRGADAGGAQVIERENVVESQRQGQAWKDAPKGFKLLLKDRLRTGEFSRAVVRLLDRTMLRMDELTDIEITPPVKAGAPGSLDVNEGKGYFFSRERQPEMNVRTPAVNGAVRGTAFLVSVSRGKTTFGLFEGELVMSNAHGNVTLRAGEFGEAVAGRAPRKTAVIDATNIIQWCLYYPAVLDADELGMPAADQQQVAASLAAYRAGDLLGALEKYPKWLRTGSTPARLYRAAVMLAVGRVDEAEAMLRAVPKSAAGRRAIEEMVAAVKFEEYAGAADAKTSGEWMARSYYEQSRSRLEPALAAAKRAAEIAPKNGYAWARVAELEFSFGRTGPALQALERGLALAPRNAQAHALRGFLLSAQNKIADARAAFDEAIALDGALGNAWLGRGLTLIRQGRAEEGRRDLQTAVTLEPTRALLHAYSGKAFSEVGDAAAARKDIERAKEIDPRDPTPWLYSAVQKKQENRYNEAIRDMEKSVELNDNRRVYRSQFLLDQDRAVRGVNLAAIFQNNGMTDAGVREAVRAVNADYASAPAHLFLSDSYDALRDPRRINLRYETAWFNERLLANLLSPVGGGPLSQYVSQQEYSKLFERDGFGLSTVTEAFSTGELRETASQFGTFGNLSYSLDAQYFYDNGLRPNSGISRTEAYATVKLQLGPHDTLFLQTKFGDLQNGDVFQRYDQREVSRPGNRAAQTLDFRELQDPALILLGAHHEWSPGNHTLLLLSRLANDQVLTVDGINSLVLTRNITSLFPADFDKRGLDPARPLASDALVGALSPLRARGTLERQDLTELEHLDYRANFEIFGGELQQIFTLGPHAAVFGGLYQAGNFETHVRLDGLAPKLRGLFLDPPARQDASVSFERINIYAYDTWRVVPWLTLTGGVTYDRLHYPDNFRQPPINEREASMEQWSPKAGFILQPTRTITLRGAYSEAISGVSFDESVRLEPTQVAGFNQAYRTIIPESIIGSVAGSRYKTWGLSLEQKLPTGTYWAVGWDLLEQDLDRTRGVFDFLKNEGDFQLAGVLPSEIRERFEYREQALTATVNQLVGDRLAIGARYRIADAELREQFHDVPRSLYDAADTVRSSVLQELSVYAVYNHPCGFFARAEALWMSQENDGFARDTAHPRNDPRPGDSFWHFNAWAGWRFHRNQHEISVGLLNITGTDYQLEPLNEYRELPRDQTVVVRAKFTF